MKERKRVGSREIREVEETKGSQSCEDDAGQNDEVEKAKGGEPCEEDERIKIGQEAGKNLCENEKAKGGEPGEEIQDRWRIGSRIKLM